MRCVVLLWNWMWLWVTVAVLLILHNCGVFKVVQLADLLCSVEQFASRTDAEFSLWSCLCSVKKMSCIQFVIVAVVTFCRLQWHHRAVNDVTVLTCHTSLSVRKPNGAFSAIFYFTTPNTDLQSLLVFEVLPCCYVTDAGRTFERRGLSAGGNIGELSFDWLTLQALLCSKFPRKYCKHSKLMVWGCKVKRDCRLLHCQGRDVCSDEIVHFWYFTEGFLCKVVVLHIVIDDSQQQNWKYFWWYSWNGRSEYWALAEYMLKKMWFVNSAAMISSAF